MAGIFQDYNQSSSNVVTHAEVDVDMARIQTAVAAAQDFFTVTLSWQASIAATSGTVLAQACLPVACTLVDVVALLDGTFSYTGDSTVAIYKRTAVGTSATCMTTECVFGSGYTGGEALTSAVVDATKASFTTNDAIELVATGGGGTEAGLRVVATFKKTLGT